jgi:hypothetical protein
MEERRGSFTFLVGEHEARRPRSRLEYNIKMDLEGIRTVVD